MKPHTFASLDSDELQAVHGGQRFQIPKPGATGSGPMTLMGLLDKPQKTFNMVKDALGIPDSGKPGDRYIPATANADGSINQGRFETPREPGAPEVPMSQ